MNDQLKKYLFDIKEAILSIESYFQGKKQFDIYSKEKMLRRAVERELEIIGEAINRLDRIDSSIEISGKNQIIGMRNRVIHGYDKVDDEIIWGIIIKNLPVLKKKVDDLLNA
ncbi:MAG: DUF86 domain-containing protein [Bacteroidetes bacterium]|nr:DUF86 domain-containing protein [Bacteroidota bacterium]